MHSSEVQRLNKKLDQVYRVAAITPKMTFIIVNKRINTRIFVKNGALMGNPVSGTIVDSKLSKTLKDRLSDHINIFQIRLRFLNGNYILGR